MESLAKIFSYREGGKVAIHLLHKIGYPFPKVL